MNSHQIATSDMTTSDKIRALARAGHSRAEIARILNKRYQHVRNVLVDDERRARPSPPPGLAEEPAVFKLAQPGPQIVFRLVLEQGGRLTLPQAVLEALEAQAGSVVMTSIDGEGVVTLRTPRASMLKAQAMLAHLRDGTLLSEELIAERRAEAARENEDG